MKTFKQFLKESNDENYQIEQIPDNYRPEFKKAGFLVRYESGNYGWKKAKWFKTKPEAEKFAKSLNESKRQLKEAKELQRSMNGSKIGFDSIGSGFEIRVDPFTGKGFSIDEHRLAFSVFSSGTVDYYKDASKEDVDLYMAIRNKEVDLADKDQPYGKVLKESFKMYDEIKKAVDDFDKRIKAITKKYGYKKV